MYSFIVFPSKKVSDQLAQPKQMLHNFVLYVLSTALVLCCGCASYPVNPPLQQVDGNAGYRMINRTLGEKNSDELFVILGLPGGGYRAVALDYGVIKYLDRIRFGADNRSLLDEVDLISSSCWIVVSQTIWQFARQGARKGPGYI
jgi:hypothetical protein